ncbi:MAG: hypothetical protein HFJ97_03525 [Eubacterium sp.]|nr:hypothetical protein [Eubacterium sp.]
MTKKYLPPEFEVDLFNLSSSSVVTTSGNMEIPGGDIEIDLADLEAANALEY